MTSFWIYYFFFTFDLSLKTEKRPVISFLTVLYDVGILREHRSTVLGNVLKLRSVHFLVIEFKLCLFSRI